MSMLQQMRKPDGIIGKIMINLMNCGHMPLSVWGLSHIYTADDDTILDVGCGGGTNIKRLLKKCPDGKVIGVDYSPISVQTSIKNNRTAIKYGRCEVIQSNVSAIPFGDNSFNIVTAFETIYFWPDLTESFKEIRRVLKNGGTFLICCEARGENPVEQKWLDMLGGIKIYRVDELAKYLYYAGFTEIISYKKGRGWLCITAKKII